MLARRDREATRWHAATYGSTDTGKGSEYTMRTSERTVADAIADMRAWHHRWGWVTCTCKTYPDGRQPHARTCAQHGRELSTP